MMTVASVRPDDSRLGGISAVAARIGG